jgi:hypothetical protein
MLSGRFLLIQHGCVRNTVRYVNLIIMLLGFVCAALCEDHSKSVRNSWGLASYVSLFFVVGTPILFASWVKTQGLQVFGKFLNKKRGRLPNKGLSKQTSTQLRPSKPVGEHFSKYT